MADVAAPNADEDIVLVTQLPTDSLFEGFAMRPNGQMLLTRLDMCELYTLDTEDETAEPKLLETNFPGANGLINLCALEGCTDEYAVIAGMVDLTKVAFSDFVVWRVAMQEDGSPPKITRMAELSSEYGATIGIMPVSKHTLLIADSGKNCIWKLDIATGESSILIADKSMEAENGHWGLNRLRILNGYVWFTNTSIGLLCRFPIEFGPVVGEIRTTGEVECLAGDILHCDGLAITNDHAAAYTASYMDGFLWKVSIDPATGEGETSVVMKNLVSPTAVELVYINGKPRIYVVCCGEIDNGWINSNDKKSWSDIAGINEAVTTTVEVTYS